MVNADWESITLRHPIDGTLLVDTCDGSYGRGGGYVYDHDGHSTSLHRPSSSLLLPLGTLLCNFYKSVWKLPEYKKVFIISSKAPGISMCTI